LAEESPPPVDGFDDGAGSGALGADELAPPPEDGVETLGAETVGAETVGADTFGVDTEGADTVGVDTPAKANAFGATRPSTPTVISAAAKRLLLKMPGRLEREDACKS
jgi:hypothetical protein